MPVKLCAFDVETEGRSPRFVCGSLFSDEECEYFTSPELMISALRKHARKGYTFLAHHAEYDIATLLWACGEDVVITYVNNTYTTATWHYAAGGKTRPIWDSMRLSAGLGLADLGEAIGIPKLEMPKTLVDRDDWRQDWVCDTHGQTGCWQCYCTRDSEIIWCYANSLREWLGPYGLNLHYSLARSAIELWQLFDPDAGQQIRSQTTRKLARSAYYGGRCEVFQYGSVGRIYTGDFRLHYGSILRDVRLPDVNTLTYSSADDRSILDGQTDGVISATVDICDQHVPPLPVSYNGRIYYPIGRCTGAWPISELRYAMGSGVEIVRVHEACYTETLVNPFFNVASILIDRRESLRGKHDAREIAIKYMLNCIPGRLGMRETTERTTYRKWRGAHKEGTLDGCDMERVGKDLFLARSHTLTKPAKTSNVLWAAIITGEGRSKLHEKMIECGTNITYCDTDSVHSTAPLSYQSDAPGRFRDAGVYDSGLYLGAKFYSLETDMGQQQVKAKGIPRKYAADFIRERHVSYQTAMGVVDGVLRGVKPAVWVDVDRVARFAPGTRIVDTPEVFSNNAQSSTTSPVTFHEVVGHVSDMATEDMI